MKHNHRRHLEYWQLLGWLDSPKCQVLAESSELQRNNARHLSDALVDRDDLITGVHVHFHGVADETAAGGFIRFDRIVREEVEHSLRLVFGDDEFKRENTRPVVVRVERRAEGVE